MTCSLFEADCHISVLAKASSRFYPVSWAVHGCYVCGAVFNATHGGRAQVVHPSVTRFVMLRSKILVMWLAKCSKAL